MFQIKAAKGWKPGAISKCLLRKLNKAKLQTSTMVQSNYHLKRTKKRVENKPTLIISKVNGEYRVEMQVSGENAEGSVEQYNPLVYKIASANNKEKILKSERNKRRLIRKAVKDVFRDPNPEVCENTCLKAYKHAVGLLPFDPINNPGCICSENATEELDNTSPSCSCDEDDVSSDCSSLDIDWEIHFTPPGDYSQYLK